MQQGITNPRGNVERGRSDLFTLLAGRTVHLESVVEQSGDLQQLLNSVAVGLVQPLGAELDTSVDSLTHARATVGLIDKEKRYGKKIPESYIMTIFHVYL